MNASATFRGRGPFLWPATGIAIGAVAAANPFYEPSIPVEAGIAAWFADLLLALVLSTNPTAARIGVLVAGLFLAVPCFLQASPLFRGLLMCCMGLPFAVVASPLAAPLPSGLRPRLAYLSTWLGTREVKRRPRAFDVESLVQLTLATGILAAAIAVVKAVSSSGPWLPVRWLAGGIMVLAFAEMATACHDFLTALIGFTAPALMRSPYRSASIAEFWTKRWNPAASALVLRRYFFAPLARHGVACALFATFLGSAVGHSLLAFMATGRWGISVMCGGFFLVQPLLIGAERWMNVRQWPTAAARVWTVGALALVSPLFVEPALQVVERSWGPPTSVLLPTIAVLGYVIGVTSLFSLAAVASHPDVAHGSPSPAGPPSSPASNPKR